MNNDAPTPIYLDHCATTPLAPAVREQMEPWASAANPASDHPLGKKARRAVETAADSILRRLRAAPEDRIVFTSGATESNTLALFGLAQSLAAGRHFITSEIEHPSVLEPTGYIEQSGYPVTYLGVGPDGMVNLDALREAFRPDTALVSIMWANHETGVIQPIEKIATECAQRGVLLHCDATQAVGRLPIDLSKVGIDLMSFSAHKFYGPKGIGGLYVRRHEPPIALKPLLRGGSQQGGIRAGTVPVDLVVGMAAALDLSHEQMARMDQHCRLLRDGFEHSLEATLSGFTFHGRSAPRLPNVSNIGVAGVEQQKLLAGLHEAAICVGSGAACSEGLPSHVLAAMGVPASMAKIRVSLGLETSGLELLWAALSILRCVSRNRPPRFRRVATHPLPRRLTVSSD